MTVDLVSDGNKFAFQARALEGVINVQRNGGSGLSAHAVDGIVAGS
jgi:hypothetical protein